MTQGPKFHKSKEVIWLTVINEIFKFPSYFDPFSQVNYLYELLSSYPINQLKNDTFELVSRNLEKDFVKYRKLYGYHV